VSGCVVRVERVGAGAGVGAGVGMGVGELPLPAYATTGSAGMDLRADLAPDEVLVLSPGARALVPTGLRFAIPVGFEGQIRPRSGLALKHGVTVLNAPGTIDSDYRGEVQVLLVNHGDAAFEIRRGDRIAQVVFAAVATATLILGELAESDQTTRGSGGFGHTGRG